MRFQCETETWESNISLYRLSLKVLVYKEKIIENGALAEEFINGATGF